MRRLCLALLLCLVQALPLSAASADEADALFDLVAMPEVIEVMQQEGLDYGDALRDELFPGRGGAAWDALVARLYDRAKMEDVVRTEFARLMKGADVDPLVTFFDSDLGQRIVRLEIEARQALIDEDLEAAAGEALDEMRQRGDLRLEVLDRFIAANDLIEANVVGAMNSNFAFYSGLMDGGAPDVATTEADLLEDVWLQEPQIRADTIDWVQAYLALAYQPLSDDEIARYTDLSRTEPGQALNRAIFGAFDEMYVTISRALGQGAAQFVAGEDL